MGTVAIYHIIWRGLSVHVTIDTATGAIAADIPLKTLNDLHDAKSCHAHDVPHAAPPSKGIDPAIITAIADFLDQAVTCPVWQAHVEANWQGELF